MTAHRDAAGGSLPRASQAGFTLIELLVVLIIVAALAGLVIPAVAMLGRSTDMAASAHTQAAMANNIQEFFVLQKRYPQGVDSLLYDGTHGADAASTQDGTPDGVYVAVNYPAGSPLAGQQLGGMTASNPALVSNLALGTLTSNQRRSFTRGGFDYVFDHQGVTIDGTTFAIAGERNSNVSPRYRRVLPGSGTMAAAVVSATTTQNMAPESGGHVFLRGLVPSELTFDGTAWDWTPEPGTQLVAVGIGAQCRIVPTTMLNIPMYPGCDGSYYGRFIAVFKVFESGERCVLVGVVDAYGRPSDYTIQQFNESLPNGSRQG